MIIKNVDVNSEDAQFLLDKLNSELFKITGNSGVHSFNNKDIENDKSIFVIAYENDNPIACGALKKINENIAEIKRVFSLKNTIGAGHRIVSELESKALSFGYTKVILETRKINSHAVDFYIGCGYKICDNYGKYVGDEKAVCFEKLL